MGCIEHVTWRTAEPEEMPETYPLLALETGGLPLSSYSFPKRGIVFVGSEELGLRGKTRKRVEQYGSIISIPMKGKKGSLNVGVALGILLYQWSQYVG
jgi:TrmH family RNA methyltransferase